MNMSFSGEFINEYKHLVGVEVREVEPDSLVVPSEGRKQWALIEMQETPLKYKKKVFHCVVSWTLCG